MQFWCHFHDHPLFWMDWPIAPYTEPGITIIFCFEWTELLPLTQNLEYYCPLCLINWTDLFLVYINVYLFTVYCSLLLLYVKLIYNFLLIIFFMLMPSISYSPVILPSISYSPVILPSVSYSSVILSFVWDKMLL